MATWKKNYIRLAEAFWACLEWPLRFHIIRWRVVWAIQFALKRHPRLSELVIPVCNCLWWCRTICERPFLLGWVNIINIRWEADRKTWSKVTKKFQSQEWSISSFPCSLTRNIASHSMENLAFHSFTQMKKMIIKHKRGLYYQFSLPRLYISL